MELMTVDNVQNRVYVIRGQRVMLDYDLSENPSLPNLRIFLRWNAYRLHEGFQESVVICKAAHVAGISNGIALGQQILGQGDAFGGNVFVNGGAGTIFKNTAQIGGCQEKLLGEQFQGQILRNMTVNIGYNWANLFGTAHFYMVFLWFFVEYPVIQAGFVDKNHPF